MRDLGQTIDDIETLDAKIAELNTERAGLLVHAETRHIAAREVGWKARGLSDAGLGIPRPLDLPGLTSTDTGALPAAESQPGVEDPRRLAG